MKLFNFIKRLLGIPCDWQNMPEPQVKTSVETPTIKPESVEAPKVEAKKPSAPRTRKPAKPTRAAEVVKAVKEAKDTPKDDKIVNTLFNSKEWILMGNIVSYIQVRTGMSKKEIGRLISEYMSKSRKKFPIRYIGNNRHMYYPISGRDALYEYCASKMRELNKRPRKNYRRRSDVIRSLVRQTGKSREEITAIMDEKDWTRSRVGMEQTNHPCYTQVAVKDIYNYVLSRLAK